MKQLLITLSKKLKRNETVSDPNKGFYEEADMFYKVQINQGIITIGNITLDEFEARQAAKAQNLTLADFLERGVQNDPELLKFCKQNRVGYIRKERNKIALPRPTNLKKVEKTRWDTFIIKILKKKGDLANLKSFTTYEP